LPPEAIEARVEGVNEIRDRVPVLTSVHVHYTLTIPAGARERVDRALARHVDRCPTAASLRGAVEVTWSADISEEATDAEA
jgi:uncharacterized OsmC-like protein